MAKVGAAAGGVGLLRLHTDRTGVVWAGDDTQLGFSTGYDPEMFFGSGVLAVPWGRVRGVRLLGAPANARLICHVQRLRAADPELKKVQRVMVAAPAIVGKPHLGDPKAVLQALWQPDQICLLKGHWHDLRDTDLCPYSMLAEAEAHGPSPALVRMLRHHPAWPALSYVPTLNPAAVCTLLNTIVDPRFFAHPDRPSRLSRLMSYLGLDRANVRYALHGGTPSWGASRATTAVHAWYNPAVVTCPFLADACAGPDPVKGVLAGTRRFVSLVARYWLSTVTAGHCEVKFRPDMFFGGAEATAFARHLTRVGRN